MFHALFIRQAVGSAKCLLQLDNIYDENTLIINNNITLEL